ncbi:MAG: ParB/RepB/Spo0J family partition protein, partial [Proteobacteria bacterium]|nr:ParB/RepB/Spo0J family partition protein [Pseudomonadota bacterium]
ETDSFKSLMQSIKDKGVLEPLLVTKGDGDSYNLICGERRLAAARQLEFELVPVRVIEAGKESGEVIALQLTENLQREDLNPMDQAKGILAYIQAKLPDKNYDVDGVMNDLVSYKRRPEELSDKIAPTFGAIVEITGKSINTLFNGLSLLKLFTGKSINTLFNGLSLLKLSPEIQAEIQAGTLPVSQGYLFAANLDCPDCDKIFEAIMKTPVTYLALEKLLTAWKKPQPDPGVTKPIPVKKQVKGLVSMKTAFEQGLGTYVREDVENYLYELQVFCDFVQQQVPNIPYGKKKPPQV